MSYLVDRMKEPSTWRGVIYIITSVGITISPEATESFISIGLLFAGCIGLLKD